ncbi:hypothetical protein [Roseibium sp. RKSG952]|uniref:hypothetical protein n=1 Tax=Roseibium sp. RKSG952 TaxID=2529384 RepID=UPI0012BD42C6|nr:hypothetical protein [Roseibium sp. RKSG952]MTH94688.1 hypothetical protein [Roseibium sp. RKSG952]
MSWWDDFKSVATSVVDFVGDAITFVGTLMGESETATRIASVFETVADAVIDIVVGVAEYVNGSSETSETAVAGAETDSAGFDYMAGAEDLELDTGPADLIGSQALQDDMQFV